MLQHEHGKKFDEQEHQLSVDVDREKFGGSFKKYLLGDKVILLLLFMGLLSIPIGMTYLKMTPVFVDKVIKGGPGLYGNLIGMASAFAAISGLMLSFMSKVNIISNITTVSNSWLNRFVSGGVSYHYECDISE